MHEDSQNAVRFLLMAEMSEQLADNRQTFVPAVYARIRQKNGR